ncbi:NUDIX hydrolase [Nocardiopsis algeriensis]|uniref:8-oxo-dGTP pyrophosphatase MutT (NUDIX family) n=1 Tax=Nocardiopsis algeriensis TaxID=1478215 RepID=A0A841IVF5_9ACTN|nr:NUDIX domain-containing protein [Nocardiopsis algeriensis]MBB6122240.1 8-oxo-dGTP pyrophosphatase MutT (NUDIX family) [Nocardiopsis algeriensis]
MTDIAKQSARALLFDDHRRLVFIKRTKPGQEPYWVSVGGGLEPEDADAEAALHREVFEELGGKIDGIRQVLLITDDLPGDVGLQHVFVARLVCMDLDHRTGTEFTEPGRGTYEVVSIPATRDALAGIRLLPPQLAEFAQANVHGLLALLPQADEVPEKNEMFPAGSDAGLFQSRDREPSALITAL